MRKIGVVVFPGTNCERDVFHVLSDVLHIETEYIWHDRQDLDGFAGLVLPGGFSYGDRLRAGVIADSQSDNPSSEEDGKGWRSSVGHMQWISDID